ncbi:MAG: hypothetical protein M3017_05615 [Actinomycetota bacterium]|nr:hypothetical protein [Actinomycetota bacterium]
MRKITTPAELYELPHEAIIVDGTDTPMRTKFGWGVTILAGPEIGYDRMFEEPTAVILPADVVWEPVT